MNTGNNLLFLIVSALLGFMAASGVLGWLNINPVEVFIHVPDEVYDGIPSEFRVEVKNRSRRPLFLLKARYREVTFPFFFVSSGESVSTVRPVVLQRRGEHDIGTIEVSSPFPVNFFLRSTSWRAPGTVIVFPAPKELRLTAGGGDSNPTGATSSGKRGYEGDITGIANYTGSEPIKLVHWRLSARHDELKVKEQADAAAPPLVINIGDLPGGSLDERLSCAAHLVNNGISFGRAVGLVTAGGVIPPGISRGHRLRLLTELARYGSH